MKINFFCQEIPLCRSARTVCKHGIMRLKTCETLTKHIYLLTLTKTSLHLGLPFAMWYR